MRRFQLALSAVVGAASLVLGAGPALGNPNPPPEPFHAGSESDKNIYVAKGGHATITFDQATQDKIARHGVSIKFIAPWTPIPGKPDAAGVFMPVGERYDSFQDDGRITYPGGLVLSLKGPDGQPHTISFNGTSLRLWPGFAGFYFNPWIDMEQPLGKDVRLLAASFFEALGPGGFFAYHPEEKSWGPTAVTLTATPEFGATARKFGIPIADGEKLGEITVRWNDRPEFTS